MQAQSRSAVLQAKVMKLPKPKVKKLDKGNFVGNSEEVDKTEKK